MSVSSAPLPTSTASRTTSGTATTAPAHTAPTTTTSPGSTVTQGSSSQPSSTTRTAPGPAFLHTGGQSASEQGAGTAAAAAAADVVVARGYTPGDLSTYQPNQTLRVLIGTRAGSADSHNQRAFFFLDNHYLGTDSSQPSASVRVVSQSDTEVALAYALYRSHDPLCCPSGGQTTVRFQLDNGRLVPLDPIPPASSATGLARQ